MARKMIMIRGGAYRHDRSEPATPPYIHSIAAPGSGTAGGMRGARFFLPRSLAPALRLTF
jgi:hypothetical protein